MERDATREPFGFALDLLYLRRRSTTVNCWVVTALRLVLHHSFITLDVFVVVLS